MPTQSKRRMCARCGSMKSEFRPTVEIWLCEEHNIELMTEIGRLNAERSQKGREYIENYARYLAVADADLLCSGKIEFIWPETRCQILCITGPAGVNLPLARFLDGSNLLNQLVAIHVQRLQEKDQLNGKAQL